MALRTVSVADCGGCRDVERVRNAVCGCALALGLLFCPSVALADDGFIGGLQDLVGLREVETQQIGYEQEFQEGYEPELREVDNKPVRALPEDASTVDYVNDTVDRFNKVKYASGSRDLLTMIVMTLGGNSQGLGLAMKVSLIAVSIGLVFMWWGIRKSKNMIMTAFRKGKASL